VGDKKNTYSSGGSLYGKATNRNCISIEICSTCTPNTSTAVSVANHRGWSFTDATLNNAVKLTKLLMKRYNIPINNVIRHYDVSGKLCPGIVGWNNETIYDVTTGKSTKEKSDSSAWLKFKDQIK
jgi:N-acetylmuramoyl-L-alanine amidase CwlA